MDRKKFFRYRKVFCLVLLLSIFLPGPGNALAEGKEEPSQLYAIAACLMDADSGRVLFEKNGLEERAMASTTKIMTLIVTLEGADLSDTVTISENAAKQPDVQLNVCTGEQYALRDLLYSLMLESHNDAAVAIAEHVGGSVEGFAGLMNQKAADLGLTHTYFITPNGLDASDANGIHHTTSIELAKIMSYCLKNSPERETFLEITRTPSWSFTDTEGKRSFTCNNHNAFLQMMDGALSGKTGFTADAGYCYVGALERDGRTFVVSLLGCGWPNNKTYKWSDTKKLMEYGIEHYQKKDILEEIRLPQVRVDQGIRGNQNDASTIYEKNPEISLAVKDPDEEMPFLLKEGEEVRVETQTCKKLSAPVKAGEKAGTVRYMLDGEAVATYDVVCEESVPALDFSWCFHKICRMYFPEK